MAVMKQLNLLTNVMREERVAAPLAAGHPGPVRSTLRAAIGYGRIGREVGRLGWGVDGSVSRCSYDPQVNIVEQGEEKVELVDLHTLAGSSDAISIHCSLNDSTRGLVDKFFLAHARDGVVNRQCVAWGGLRR